MADVDKVQGRVATDVVRVSQGVASQSGNLHEWRNSAGGILSRVDSSGNFIGPGGSAPVDAAVIYMGALEGDDTKSTLAADNANALFWMITSP